MRSFIYWHVSRSVVCKYNEEYTLQNFLKICTQLASECPFFCFIVETFSWTKYVLIALIHPIQWTIAYPVRAGWPAKCQKNTSCVSTGQAGPVLCTRQVACRTSFLSRQHDVTASFSFGTRSVQANIFSD